jgi:parvulin-like peptidyl-prolyl isomerase
MLNTMMRIYTVLIFFIFCSVSYSSLSGEDEELLVSVGTRHILFSEFSERYTDYILATGVKDNPALRSSILNNMVNEILLRYYDDNTKIFNNPEYLKEDEWTERQVLLAYLKDHEIYTQIPVTEDEIRETFIRLNESISASHLYAPTEEEALQLWEMLNIGVDWDNLAYQVFSDSILRTTGGYLGFFTWGDMDPAFENAAYSLKPGEYSRPVKTSYGYSIIRTEERKPHPLLTEWEFNLKKPKLTSILRLRKKKSSEREYVNNILKESGIKFIEGAVPDLFDKMNSLENNIEAGLRIQDKKVLTFFNRDYTEGDLIDKLNNIPSFKRNKIESAENLKSVITGLLLQDKLYEKASAAGYDTIYFVQDKLAEYKMRNFIKYKQHAIVNEIIIPEENLRKYYSENISYFTSPEEINLQEIIVDHLSLADSLKYLIDSGEDFGRLAGEFSIREWSAENNGEMGFVPASKLGMLQDIFNKAEVGEFIGPLRIEDKFGLFRILGKKNGMIKDFEEVRDLVLQAVKFEKRGEYMMNHLKDLYVKVDIEINYELLKEKPIAGLN